jgi:hypothetical protein
MATMISEEQTEKESDAFVGLRLKCPSHIDGFLDLQKQQCYAFSSDRALRTGGGGSRRGTKGKNNCRCL